MMCIKLYIFGKKWVKTFPCIVIYIFTDDVYTTMLISHLERSVNVRRVTGMAPGFYLLAVAGPNGKTIFSDTQDIQLSCSSNTYSPKCKIYINLPKDFR